MCTNEGREGFGKIPDLFIRSHPNRNDFFSFLSPIYTFGAVLLQVRTAYSIVFLLCGTAASTVIRIKKHGYSYSYKKTRVHLFVEKNTATTLQSVAT